MQLQVYLWLCVDGKYNAYKNVSQFFFFWILSYV
jgi:hypothetical protein